MNPRFMLDTNAVSAFMHGRSRSLDRQISIRSRTELCVSAISHGETLYGLANRPEAGRLAKAAAGLFDRVEILPWTSETAGVYGDLRAKLRQIGKPLPPLNLLIAAHALETGAILVSSDRAFRHVPGLTIEDWTAG